MIKTPQELRDRIESCSARLADKFEGKSGKRAIVLCGGTGCLSSNSKEIREKFPFMMYAPVLFVSALTNQRMNKILETVDYVASEHAKRVSTSALNDVIGEAVMLNQPPSDKGRRLKIYYGSQTGTKPPKFTLFINDKQLTHFSYQRYLENKIRENFGFEGTSVQFEYREKNKRR